MTGIGLLTEAQTSDMWSESLGEADTSNIVRLTSSSTTLSSVVLISNIPQLIISFLYVMYNNLFTCMLSAAEVSDFAKEQKTLRVSEPKGQQRSTYWLSLPYRYAIPLMTSMGLLHWFISQSIFLLNLEVYDQWGNLNDNSSMTACGYSAKGIFASVILGGFMILVVIGFGFKRFAAGMPVLSNCSIAMSAACHPLPTDVGISQFSLKYGVLQDSKEEDDHERVGFGTIVLRPLVDGHHDI